MRTRKVRGSAKIQCPIAMAMQKRRSGRHRSSNRRARIEEATRTRPELQLRSHWKLRQTELQSRVKAEPSASARAEMPASHLETRRVMQYPPTTKAAGQLPSVPAPTRTRGTARRKGTCNTIAAPSVNVPASIPISVQATSRR